MFAPAQQWRLWLCGRGRFALELIGATSPKPPMVSAIERENDESESRPVRDEAQPAVGFES
jgi:hypothetical protein